MFYTEQQSRRAMWLLSLFHVLIIASSNYLVQLPISIFGVHTTWGAFSFPFIFLATDLTVRIFGSVLARHIILRAMMPALVISYLFSVIFNAGEFVGASSLSSVNWFVARIACASFMAYLLGQILDISVFNKLRQSATWWLAPTASTIIGNLLDTIVFFGIAFYQSPDPFMAEHWVEIASVDYAVKLVISIGLFVPAYGILLRYLIRKLIGTQNVSWNTI